jgi:hypothetical protein
MSLLRWCLALLAIAAALQAGGGAQQTSTAAPQPTRRVWNAEWKHGLQDPGRPYSRQIDWRIAFTGVEEVLPDGTTRWLSRQLTWKMFDIYQQIGTIAYDPSVGRYRINIIRTCSGGGTVDLGPADGPQPSAGAPRMRGDCQEVVESIDGRGPGSRRQLPGEDVNDMPAMRPPLEGCSVSEATRHVQGDSVGTSSYSLTIAPYVDAVMEVSTDSEYGRYVPAPDAPPLRVSAHVRTPAKALFRFELAPDETSRFPGYATNANVDAAFFDKYQLGDLFDQYKNDGPDEVFLPKDYGSDEWLWQDFSAVETRQPQTSAVATIRAMDYGAVGRLRGFVKVDDCGGWQPITALVDGKPRDGISVPLDEDNNLMADALQEFRGLDSGVDDDAEPVGNGMRGDGFTAFEEYRGFLVSVDFCVGAKPGRHGRGSPTRKNLFVRTPDPDLLRGLHAFQRASGLMLSHICEDQYSGDPVIDWNLRTAGDVGVLPTDRARIVNHTLQLASLRTWRGHAISQDQPQHAIYMISANLDEGTLGKTLHGSPFSPQPRQMGPPVLTSVILIDKSQAVDETDVAMTVTHELGHGVGLPHHGRTVDEQWTIQPLADDIRARSGEKLLIAPGGICAEDSELDDIAPAYDADGQFLGCLTRIIVVRGGEHSGASDCPMRYRFANRFFGVPSSSSDTADSATIARVQSLPPETYAPPATARVYAGRFFVYRNDEEDVGLGKFCASGAGTGLNRGDDEHNHAGDANDPPCAQRIVVNDTVVRRGR